MQAGKYDQRIEFINYGSKPDGSGGFDPVREVMLSSWCSIEQIKQRRDLEAVQQRLPSAYRVKMMPRKDFEITEGMTVEWRGMTMQVLTTPQVGSVRMMDECVFDIGESVDGTE